MKIILLVLFIIIASVLGWIALSKADKAYWEERDRRDMEEYRKRRIMNYPDIICENREDKNKK